MPRKSNDENKIVWTKHSWTQEEIDALHEMVQEYTYARWLRKQIYKLLVWILGLPAAVLMVWEPFVRLWASLRSFIAG